MTWRDLYTRPLFDLGANGEEALRDIYSPGYDPAVVRRYVQWQFLDSHEESAAKLEAVPYWRDLLADAIARAGLRGKNVARILDLGSGGGNTIFPLVEFFPGAMLLASDFSVKMLVELKRALAKRGLSGRCGLMELNAEYPDFVPGSFDLVVGGAILHHLHEPALSLAGCARILAPGGHAIFFEPFENGNGILAVAFKTILEDVRADQLPFEARRFLRVFTDDYHLRKGRDKTDPRFRLLDDKWFFTRRCLQEWIDRCGFSDWSVYPIQDVERQFQQQTEVYLRLASGRGGDAFPDWAWDIVRMYDQAFSPDMKADLLIEGCIILRK